MKIYFYTGIDANGKQITSQILAKNKSEATNSLTKQGIIIKKIYVKLNVLSKINIFKDNFEFFIKSLSNLISSGIPLTDSLYFISSGQAGQSIQNAGMVIFEDIKNGATLYKSIKNFYPNSSNFHLSLISAGEKSGNIEEALKSVSNLIDENKTKKAELISSLTYPSILLITMLALIFFILEFALPKMLNVMDLKSNLPIATSVLIKSGEVLPSLIKFIFYAVLTFCILIVIRNRFIFTQKFLDFIFMKVPIFNNILIILSRRTILQIYSIGLNGGLSIQQTNTLVIESIPNHKIKQKLILLNESIESGERFSLALEKTKLLNLSQITSIKIGDETDSLKENFKLLKNQFENQLSLYLKTIAKIIEPTIILIFGFIILILALGIILPVLDATKMIM